MAGLSIPDATDALVTLFGGIGDRNFEVFDGPEYNPEGDFLAVGWSDRTGNPVPSASGTAADTDFGLSQSLETYGILHLLRVWVGDETLSDARRRLFGYMAEIRAALAADYSLGGVVMQAWVGAFDLTPNLNTNGGFLDFAFTITIRAAR